MLTHTAGASFDYSGAGTDVVYGLSLTTTGDVLIQGPDSALKASRVDLNARGYSGATGPGAGITGQYPGGGAHGGAGRNGVTTSGGDCYGSVLQPTLFGSGGGSDNGASSSSPGGRGGGAIRLTVGGLLTVDGVFSANGENRPAYEAAGGAGGSIWITCGGIAGTGSITASGGAGNTSWSGGGGGGRIALYTCNQQMPLFSISAAGGAGWRVGDHGSVVVGGNSVQVFSQPASATYVGGQEVSLVVDAAGDGLLAFQWYRNGSALADDDHISGSSTHQLTFSPIDCDDGGVYYCLVTDTCGSFPTDPASITVLPSADYDGSGFVDTDDFTAFVIDFELGVDQADFDGTGFVDTDDFTAFVLAFEAGC